ncbi:MAG: RDD family protein [Actinomycetota bacterium]|nr:RDD family protein [Actinomycetota bacterium]
MQRHEIGAWLEGPGAGLDHDADEGYRGQRLGLPERGPGSLARIGRRIAALVVDWFASMLVTLLFLPWAADAFGLVNLAVFTAEVLLGTVLGGASFGHRVARLRVLDLRTGRPPRLGPAAVRTVLLALAVPPLVWDRDGRGLHDKIARTVVVNA